MASAETQLDTLLVFATFSCESFRFLQKLGGVLVDNLRG